MRFAMLNLFQHPPQIHEKLEDPETKFRVTLEGLYYYEDCTTTKIVLHLGSRYDISQLEVSRKV